LVVLAHNWHTKIPVRARVMNARICVQSRTKTMNDQKWIVSDKDHLGGKPRVQGTRISVAFLLECLASGMSVAEVVDAYPTLTENAVQSALRELAHEKEAAAT
jgi:uncharacterized protein (DUF433 family)